MCNRQEIVTLRLPEADQRYGEKARNAEVACCLIALADGKQEHTMQLHIMYAMSIWQSSQLMKHISFPVYSTCNKLQDRPRGGGGGTRPIREYTFKTDAQLVD